MNKCIIHVPKYCVNVEFFKLKHYNIILFYPLKRNIINGIGITKNVL